MDMNTEIVVYVAIGLLGLLTIFLVLREALAEKRREIDTLIAQDEMRSTGPYWTNYFDGVGDSVPWVVHDTPQGWREIRGGREDAPE